MVFLILLSATLLFLTITIMIISNLRLPSPPTLPKRLRPSPARLKATSYTFIKTMKAMVSMMVMCMMVMLAMVNVVVLVLVMMVLVLSDGDLFLMCNELRLDQAGHSRHSTNHLS